MTRLRSNFNSGTLSAAIATVGATTATSAAFAGLPVVAGLDRLAIVIDPTGVGGNPEIVWVSVHTAASTTITMIRGQEGTTARTHLINTAWTHAATVKDWEYDIDAIGDALLADPAYTPSGQILDSSEITANLATTTAAPGVTVTGLTVVVPATDVPVTIGWGGHLIGPDAKFAGVSLYEDGVELDRAVTGFGFANDLQKVWTETLVDPSASSRAYTAKLWSNDGVSSVSVFANPIYPWRMIARAG